MELVIAIELALMLVLQLKISIGNIERELKRKPIKYEETDWPVGRQSSDFSVVHSPFTRFTLLRHPTDSPLRGTAFR